METLNILGVRIACVTTLQILQTVQTWIHQAERRTITYVNAHCLNMACSIPDYHQILNHVDLVYPDGISVVWAGRLLDSGCQMQKSTGADWIELFCECAATHNWRVYILAGRPGIAHRARENLLRKQPGLQIVGAYDGFFIEKNEREILDDIRETAPHVLFVGMGSPRQELWIARRREELHVPVCWAVGALFDYVAGVEPRVPPWMNRLALEWLWRMLVDPFGKWKRYILGNPLFVYRVLRQVVQIKLLRSGV